jgi:pimeloyl-ACP methyl ester carboxylesterase
MRGEMIDIGGRALRIVRAGPAASDHPVVVLEAGAFGFSADWAAVQGKLGARGFASLAYDRAGLGRSDPGPPPRDGAAIGADLEALLETAAPKGPLVLVGHSMAGLHVHRLAARWPARVAGLVLVDATTPAAMNSGLVSLFVGQFGALSKLAAWTAGTGLLKPLAGTGLGDMIGLSGDAASEKRWAFADAAHNAAAAAEVEAWRAAARQALAAGDLDPMLPVAVVLAGPAGANAAYKALQSAPAEASFHGLIDHVDGATHASILGEEHASAIVRGVEHVWRAGAVAEVT